MRALVVVLVSWFAGVAGTPVPGSQATTPSAFDVTEKSIRELQAVLTDGTATSRQLVEGYLARIAAYDQAGPHLNAFITINPRALETADALDRERRERGPRGPLHGIPLAIKDNFDTVDLPTTGGSLALATNRPVRDAFQVERLRAAGAIVIGKTNLHELAAGIVTVSSLGGQTRDPYDPSRNPGGSSGGTGAAVAASLAAAGLGSDTCGSIRIPSSHNALVGLRPTSGLSSRSGVIPLSLTQDVAGPLARSVEDLALLLDATVGPDPRDPSTEASRGRIPQSYVAGLEAGTLLGERIGVLTVLFGDAAADLEVWGLLRPALDRMRSAGAVVVDLTVPDLAELLRGSSVIDYEFKFQLADYLAEAVSPPVRSLGEILERGLHHEALTGTFRRRNATESRDSDAYRAALARRDEIRTVVVAAMDAHRLTALAYPTMRRKPAPVGESQQGSNCQLSASTGMPALALPAAFTTDGLPIALELLGRPWSEARLLGIGRAFERTGPGRRTPPSTPPLAPDARPGRTLFESRAGEASAPTSAPPGFSATFSWEPARGVLAYEARAIGVEAGEVILLALRQGEGGPIAGRLLRTGEPDAIGEVALSDASRELLLAGKLVAQLYTRAAPHGGPSAPVAIR